MESEKKERRGAHSLVLTFTTIKVYYTFQGSNKALLMKALLRRLTRHTSVRPYDDILSYSS
jgi:hypothetical protein